MLRLPPFTYVAPGSLEEVVEALHAHGPDAMIVAGGTDLYPNMKRRQFEPKVLVGLTNVPELRRIEGTPGTGLTVGAGATRREVSTHPVIREHYYAVAKAAGLVSTTPLRNMGTIGGNLCVDPRCNYYNMPFPWRKAVGFCLKKDGDICLVAPGSPRCWALSSSDLAPVSIALEAKLRLIGPRGTREVGADDFYRDDGIDYLTKEKDEVLTEIRLPPAKGLRTTYWKLRRRGSFDFPLLGVAVALTMDDGEVTRARLALGAVASRPKEVVETRELLEGKVPTEADVHAVADAAFDLAKPLDNADGHFYWRKRMVRPYVQGALKEVLRMGPPESWPREYN
ncbi:MAG: FAD binding domain-containing protein [Thermoplasmata archaeon]